MFTCARKLPQNSSTFAGRTPAVSVQAGGTQTETRQQLTQSPGPLCVTQQVVSGAPDVQVGDGGGGDVGGSVTCAEGPSSAGTSTCLVHTGEYCSPMMQSATCCYCRRPAPTGRPDTQTPPGPGQAARKGRLLPDKANAEANCKAM